MVTGGLFPQTAIIIGVDILASGALETVTFVTWGLGVDPFPSHMIFSIRFKIRFVLAVFY